VGKQPSVKRGYKKTAAYLAAVYENGLSALFLGGLGRLFDGGLLAFQVGNAALLFDHFVVLFTHGINEVVC
jgi:hypothetical protein